MCYTECWSKAAIGSVLFFTDTHTRTNTLTKWHSQHVLCSTVWYGREHSIDNWFQTSLVDSQCNFLDAELAKCGFFEFGTYVWLPQLMNKDNVSCHIWQHCTYCTTEKFQVFQFKEFNSRIQFKGYWDAVWPQLVFQLLVSAPVRPCHLQMPKCRAMQTLRTYSSPPKAGTQCKKWEHISDPGCFRSQSKPLCITFNKVML